MLPKLGTRLNRTHLLSQGLTAAWLMNANEGAIVNEFVSGYHGEIFGGNWVADGVYFDADYERISTVAASENFIFTSGSMFCRITNSGAVPGKQGIFAVGDGYTDFACYISPSSGGDITFRINSSGHNFLNTGIDDGFFHTVGVTWNDADNIINVYIDGILFDTSSNAFSWNSSDFLNNFSFGGRPNKTAYYLNGAMSFMYLYDYVINAQNIAALHFNPYQIFERNRFRAFEEQGAPPAVFTPLIIGPF
ncbi:MAG: LamG domain-containing protein [Desulfobacteraceae bacterium]|nr:LamG domain-containing protein [Desulfobacteraceae bacterium]